MTVVRWTFFDPTDSSSYTFEVNPNRMTSPYPDLGTDLGAQSPVTGQYRVFRGPVLPHEWTFGGVIRTATHHDALKLWVGKTDFIHVTDHFGRTFQVLFKEFAPKEQLPTATNANRYEYDVKALVLGQVS